MEKLSDISCYAAIELDSSARFKHIGYIFTNKLVKILDEWCGN